MKRIKIIRILAKFHGGGGGGGRPIRIKSPKKRNGNKKVKN
jgi:hypothetical protein